MTTTPVEADVDPSDPYAREAQTFPRLGRRWRRGSRPTAPRSALAKGTLLFERGQRGVDFFLVLEGTIEIFDVGRARRDRTSSGSTRAGEFTGELDLFNERQILVSARTGVDSRVVRVKRADFRRLVALEPDIGEIIMRAFILRRVGLIRHPLGGVVLIGPGRGGDTLRLEQFMTRNGYPHQLLDTDVDPDAGGFLECFNLTPEQLPVVIAPGNRLLRNPSNAALADGLGLTETLDPAHVYDVAVVGAGPAGLAAAVYAASEGLPTIVIERLAPGGQAGTSSKIENYLGFPTGISGQALAGRAFRCRRRSSARGSRSRAASTALDCERQPYRLHARRRPVGRGARDRDRDRRPLPQASTCRATPGSRARASSTPRPPWRRSSA